jgi:hypothetical protein
LEQNNFQIEELFSDEKSEINLIIKARILNAG